MGAAAFKREELYYAPIPRRLVPDGYENPHYRSLTAALLVTIVIHPAYSGAFVNTTRSMVNLSDRFINDKV